MAAGSDAGGAFGDRSRYLEGYVEKKTSKDKDYTKVFAIIFGNELCLYPQKVTAKEQEKQKPAGRITLEKSCKITTNREMLTLKSSKSSIKDLKMKFNSIEERDNWYLRLYTIIFEKPPQDIPLLPGQKQIARDILNEEERRKGLSVKTNSRTKGTIPRLPSDSVFPDDLDLPTTPAPPPPNIKSPRDSFNNITRDPLHLCPANYALHAAFPPPWFFGKIPRQHADDILKKNPNHGDLLVRNSESVSGADQFSLSVRQTSRDGGVIVRHYKLKRDNGRYKLDIDEEHAAKESVFELLLFFIEKSGGHLRMFETQDPKVVEMPLNLYENRFSPVLRPDPENGEHGGSTRRKLSMQGSFISRQSLPYMVPLPPTTPETEDYMIPNAVQHTARQRSISLPNTNQPDMFSIPKKEEDEYIQPSHKYANMGNNVHHSIPDVAPPIPGKSPKNKLPEIREYEDCGALIGGRKTANNNDSLDNTSIPYEKHSRQLQGELARRVNRMNLKHT